MSESYTDIEIFPLKNRVVRLIVSYFFDSTEVTCQIQSIIVIVRYLLLNFLCAISAKIFSSKRLQQNLFFLNF